MNTPPLPFIDLEEALQAAERSQAFRLAVFGPPGSGKTTQVLQKRILPAIYKHKLVPVVLTPFRAHAERLGCATLAAFMSNRFDKGKFASALENVVVIVDEAGLVEPCHWAMLDRLHPAGLVIVGDPFQLTRCGDLFDITERLRLSIAWTSLHGSDRFGGNKAMHETLQVLDKACYQDHLSGKHRTSGPGTFPQDLEDDLKHVKFFDTTEEATAYLQTKGMPILACGWRHKYTDDDPELEVGEASTVHALQGRTVDNMAILITDYDCDPRLLRTAISRATSLDAVAVVRRKVFREYKYEGSPFD